MQAKQGSRMVALVCTIQCLVFLPMILMAIGAATSHFFTDDLDWRPWPIIKLAVLATVAVLSVVTGILTFKASRRLMREHPNAASSGEVWKARAMSFLCVASLISLMAAVITWVPDYWGHDFWNPAAMAATCCVFVAALLGLLPTTGFFSGRHNLMSQPVCQDALFTLLLCRAVLV